MFKTPISRMVNERTALMTSAALICMAAPQAVFAQNTNNQTNSDVVFADISGTGDGNEIIVTATKREQTLQDVPVAVTVASAEAIQRAEVRDLKDLTSIVPSLRVTQLQSSANTNFIIRGFGNGANNAGIEPSVGVFVDGVYRSRTASQINDLPNISRVEVLRGPQSTLFGKNASAGVISIVTEEPRFDFGGSVEAGYGNYDAVVARGYLTGPISEVVAASIAGGLSKRDGYMRDLGTGDRSNGRDRWFVRGQVLVEPSSSFKARFIGDFDKIDEICCGSVNLQSSLPPQLGGPPGGGATVVIQQLGGGVTDPSRPFDNITYNNINSTNDIENWGVSAQFDADLGGVQVTSISAFRNNRAITAQDADFTSADLIRPLAADVNIDTFTQEVRFTADVGDVAQILIGAFYINDKVKQTGQLFWGSQTRPYVSAMVAGLSDGQVPDIVTLEGLLGGLEGDQTKYLNRFFREGDGNHEAFKLNSEAFSIFGQVDIDLAPGLTLTLGGNYTKDTKDYAAKILGTDVFSQIDLVANGNTAIYQQGLASTIGGPDFLNLGRPATAEEIGMFAMGNPDAFGLVSSGVQAYADANELNPAVNPLLALRPLQFVPQFLNVPNEVEDGHISDDDFSYTVRLAYDISDQLNIYASYATGFKAASVNLSRDSRPLLADAAALEAAGLTRVNQTYGTRFASPEESTVYELGLKGNWGRAAANVAVFKQEITGFQSNIFTGSGFALANAGKQSTWGVEFEGRAELFDGFTANLGVTYLDPKYDDFKFSAVGDLSGTRPGGIPTWTVVLGGNYERQLGDGRLILSSTYHFESDVKINEGLPGFLSLGVDAAIGVADQFHRQVDELTASIGYAFDNGFEVNVWGRNLLNDRYLVQVFDSVAQPLAISGYPNQSRMYGVTARYRF